MSTLAAALPATLTAVVTSVLTAGQAAPPPQEPAATTESITRHGITWHFEHARQVGTFVNGDPWVVGPVRITAIDPRCSTQDGRTRHGSMVDPDPGRMQHGYDSMLFGSWAGDHYRPELNSALDLANQPLLLLPQQSLVSVKSGPNSNNEQPQLALAAVLTCVATMPGKGAFRPPYCKAAPGLKELRYHEPDLDYGALARLHRVRDMPTAEQLVEKFDKLWLDHFPSWVGRFAHPYESMNDYGRDLAADTGSAALALNSNLRNQNKRDLLVRFVQLGIDTHAIVRSGGHFAGNGGHGSGRKFPILLAGAVLHSEEMLAVGGDFVSERRSSDGPGTAFFGEDAQTFFVEQTAPGEFNWGHGGYCAADLGMPEWGFAHTRHPEKDSKGWDDNNYRRCCSANAWVGYALAARAMGLVEAWNHRAFFDYCDRYMQVERRPRWRAWVGWHASMWERHRAEY